MLFEHTHGDPDEIDEQTVVEVLEKVEQEIRQPAEDEAAAERQRAAAAEAEIGRLKGEIAALRAWKDEREAERAARQASLRKVRRISGHAGAALTVVLFAALGVAGILHGKVAWATASVALVAIVASSWAWGTRRPVSATALKACIGAGAATALWFAGRSFRTDQHRTAPAHTRRGICARGARSDRLPNARAIEIRSNMLWGSLHASTTGTTGAAGRLAGAMGAKEAERAELHKTIWRIANDLRGSVDGWDFKTYVLGMLFYRFISENLTAYLNEQERQAGTPDFDYARSARRRGRARAARRRSRRRASTSCPASCSSTSARGPRNDENLNETLASGSSATSRARRSVPTARTTSRVCSTTSTSTRASSAPTVAKRNEKLVKLLDAIGDLEPRRLRRQHDRRVRRRLRVPDDDVRLERRQVRRRVLHAAGGVGAAGPDHGRRQDRGQQGLRPGLRLGLAAPEVREGARPRQRPARVLRPGGQPHDLQPVRGSTCSCTTSTTRSSTSPTATR